MPTAADSYTVDGKLRWLPQLDGLRCVAVLMVFGNHDGVPHFFGGQIGVDIFFVLSGFLITTLLLVELRNTGSIDLRHFYIRRFRRLYPAMLAMIGGTAILTLAIRPADIGRTFLGMVLALGYLTGEARGLGIGNLGLMNHTWSLSVEELFYLLFPLALLIASRKHIRVPVAVYVATILSIAYRLLLAIIHTGTDFDRLFFSPDARAEQLLIGCSLACLLWNGSGRLVRNRFALAVAVCFLAWCFSPQFTSSRYFTFGADVVALSTAALIARLVTAPRSVPARLLAARPLVWLGRRSYAFYLCHYPIIGLVFQVVQKNLGLAWRFNFVASLVLSILAATLLHSFVEQRFRLRSH